VNTLRPHIVRMAERYPALDLPVEIVHGTEDEIVPLAIHSAPLAERVPGANLVILEGVGHMPHHADPEAVVAAIDRAAARAGLR
jgi:pimeloyl-ACP methyl ester carboxylesterase